MSWNTPNHPNAMVAPINTNIGGDLQKALNTRYNGDIGETIKRAADNDRINKWAKYKPIVHTATGYITDAQRRIANQGFHVAPSATYDADSFYQTSATNCWNAANAASADWLYDKAPTGTIGTSPYRLFDLLHIESDLSKIASHDGYKKFAAAPYRLNTIGIYPNSGTVANTVDCACTFYYDNEDLLMPDFAAYYDRLATHDWYYCLVAKVPGDNGNVSVIPLMTELRGSTKMAVGTPSSDFKVGYFTLPLTQQTSGTVQAFLAIYGVNKTTGDDAANFIFLPVGRNANFDISAANPSAELNYAWANINDPRQPSPALRGLRISLYQSVDGYVITEAHFRILLGIPNGYSASNKFTVRVTPKIVGVVENEERGWSSGTDSYEIDPNNLPQDGVTYLDVDLTGLNIATESVDSAKISIEAQFGAESPFYLEPIHADGGSMYHGSPNVELFESVGHIKSVLGSNYVSDTIINQQPL